MTKYHKYDDVYGHVELEFTQTGSNFQGKLTKTDAISFLSFCHAIVRLVAMLRLQIVPVSQFFKQHADEHHNTQNRACVAQSGHVHVLL